MALVSVQYIIISLLYQNLYYALSKKLPKSTLLR